MPRWQIGHMVSDFSEKFGIPRQSGLVEELESLVVFEPQWRDENALRGIEGFSHVWLIWESLRRGGRAGRLRCARRGWGAISAWACLPRAHRSAPIRWG